MKKPITSGSPSRHRIFFAGLMIGLALLVTAGSPAWGAYIADDIPITLRRGPGTQYRILKSLSGGAGIEILEEGDPYFKVRAADGTEGYVLKQYVTQQEPHAVIAARLQRQQAALRKQVDTLTERNQELEGRQSETHATLQQTEAELKKVREQYESLREGAQNVTETMAERDRLLEESRQQAQKIADLEKENNYLWRNNILRWFFAGAGVLFFGWLLGRRPPRRTRSF